MKQYVIALLCSVLLLFGTVVYAEETRSVEEPIIQRGPANLGIRVTGLLPLDSLQDIASEGMGIGLDIDQWITDTFAASCLLSYQSFSGSKGYVPFELGGKLYFASLAKTRYYGTLRGGAYFGIGDFNGVSAGLSGGLGIDIPLYEKYDVRFMFEPVVSVVFDDSTFTYMGLNVVLPFAPY